MKACNAQCHTRASDVCVDTRPGTPLLSRSKSAGGFLSSKLGVAVFPYLYVPFITRCYQTCFNGETHSPLCHSAGAFGDPPTKRRTGLSKVSGERDLL